jgi:hypothetical protein
MLTKTQDFTCISQYFRYFSSEKHDTFFKLFTLDEINIVTWNSLLYNTVFIWQY